MHKPENKINIGKLAPRLNKPQSFPADIQGFTIAAARCNTC